MTRMSDLALDAVRKERDELREEITTLQDERDAAWAAAKAAIVERDQLRSLIENDVGPVGEGPKSVQDELREENARLWHSISVSLKYERERRTERDEARSQREALWMLLDHIDTLDDACRDDDLGFRTSARKFQQKRWKIYTPPREPSDAVEEPRKPSKTNVDP